jgi:hypothetical protein
LVAYRAPQIGFIAFAAAAVVAFISTPNVVEQVTRDVANLPPLAYWGAAALVLALMCLLGWVEQSREESTNRERRDLKANLLREKWEDVEVAEAATASQAVAALAAEKARKAAIN